MLRRVRIAHIIPHTPFNILLFACRWHTTHHTAIPHRYPRQLMWNPGYYRRRLDLLQEAWTIVLACGCQAKYVQHSRCRCSIWREQLAIMAMYSCRSTRGWRRSNGRRHEAHGVPSTTVLYQSKERPVLCCPNR